MCASETVKVKSYNLFNTVVANFGVFADSVVRQESKRRIRGEAGKTLRRINTTIRRISDAIEATSLDTYEVGKGLAILNRLEDSIVKIIEDLEVLKELEKEGLDAKNNVSVLIRELLYTICKNTFVSIRKEVAKFVALGDMGEEFILRGLTLAQSNSRYRLIKSAYFEE